MIICHVSPCHCCLDQGNGARSCLFAMPLQRPHRIQRSAFCRRCSRAGSVNLVSPVWSFCPAVGSLPRLKGSLSPKLRGPQCGVDCRCTKLESQIAWASFPPAMQAELMNNIDSMNDQVCMNGGQYQHRFCRSNRAHASLEARQYDVHKVHWL